MICFLHPANYSSPRRGGPIKSARVRRAEPRLEGQSALSRCKKIHPRCVLDCDDPAFTYSFDCRATRESGDS